MDCFLAFIYNDGSGVKPSAASPLPVGEGIPGKCVTSVNNFAHKLSAVKVPSFYRRERNY